MPTLFASADAPELGDAYIQNSESSDHTPRGDFGSWHPCHLRLAREMKLVFSIAARPNNFTQDGDVERNTPGTSAGRVFETVLLLPTQGTVFFSYTVIFRQVPWFWGQAGTLPPPGGGLRRHKDR